MVQYVSIASWINKKQRPAQDQVIRKITLDIDRSLSRRSPVDTGRFKGNWQLGVNAQPLGYDWELKDKRPRGQVGDTVGIHAGILPKQAAGGVYWLVNNLPYANALELGHSKQAPAPWGIVKITLIKFQGIVESAMSEVK